VTTEPPPPASAPRLGVLVDEDLDPALAGALAAQLGPTADVSSTRVRGWLGVHNGPLLDAMADTGLGVLVTGDVRLWRERRGLLERVRIGIVLVRDPKSATVPERVGAIAQAVRQVAPGELMTVPT
jgi:hypothetical protein